MLSKLRLLPSQARLRPKQKDVQRLTGDLRWMTRRVIVIVRAVHILSCVAACSEEEQAMLCCLGVLAMAFHARYEGLTWGGCYGRATQLTGALKGTKSARSGTTIGKVDGVRKLASGAPAAMEGASDATWSLCDMQLSSDETERYVIDNIKSVDVYVFAVTANGALVALELKRVGPTCGSSAQVEGFGLLKLTDRMVWLRMVAVRFGIAVEGPSLLMCDAEAALRAAAGESSVQRLKHALRRAAQVTQRIRDGDVELAHLPDSVNFVDCFTKWVSLDKMRASMAYLTGAIQRAAYGGGDVSATSHAMVVCLNALAAAYIDYDM